MSPAPPPVRAKCPQCGAALTWLPVKGEMLREVQSDELCRVITVSARGAVIEWPDGAVGCLRVAQVQRGFCRLMPACSPPMPPIPDEESLRARLLRSALLALVDGQAQWTQAARDFAALVRSQCACGQGHG